MVRAEELPVVNGLSWSGEGGNDGLARVEAERGVGMQTVSQLLGEGQRTKCVGSEVCVGGVCVGVCVCVCQRRKVMREAMDSEAGSFSSPFVTLGLRKLLICFN